MRKSLLLFILFITSILTGFAQSITKERAEQIAIEFLHAQSTQFKSDTPGSLSLIYTCTDSTNLRSDNKNGFYYIFNINQKEGFIIVSGEEATQPILGYSFNNGFRWDMLADNTQSWLDNYKQQIQKIIQYKTSIPPKANSIVRLYEKQALSSATHLLLQQYPNSTNYAEYIAPLIKTQWGQQMPYNNLCPLDKNKRSATGCIATAIAQIMKFHEWPVRGIGTKTYTTQTKGIQVSTDFSSTVYDWNHMKKSYNKDFTETEATAVATLMRHIGGATEMDYTNYESGTYDKNAGIALITHFNYNPNIQILHREYFREDEWKSIIKSQLNTGLPLYYSGYRKQGGGHAFVCDGYDNNGLFHINWGGNGNNDGYFVLELLNPYSPGTGSSIGTYTENQTILWNTCPSFPESKPIHLLFLTPATDKQTIWMDSEMGIDRTSSFNVNLQYYNRGLNLFDGAVAIGLMKDNQIISVLKEFQFTIQPNHGYKKSIYPGLKISTTIPDGNYQICALYKQKDESNWNIMGSTIGYPNHIKVCLSQNSILFGEKTENKPAFSVKQIVSTQQTIHTNSIITFSSTLENVGNGTYNGRLGIGIVNVNDPNNTQQIIPEKQYTIQAGQTQEYIVTGKITVPPGTYTLYPMVEENGDILLLKKGNNVIIYKESIDFNLSVVNEITTENKQNLITEGEETSFYATVKNTGNENYEGLLGIYLLNTSGNIYDETGWQRVYSNQYKIAPGETVAYSAKGIIKVKPDTYYAYVTFQRPNKTDYIKEPFSTIVCQSSFETFNEPINKDFKVYPNPVSDRIYINCDGETLIKIQLFNSSGKIQKTYMYTGESFTEIPMYHFHPGNYLLQIQTNKNIYTKPIIKK